MRGRLRKAVVVSIIVATVGVTVYSIARRREYWPVSHYPMYSGLLRSKFQGWEIYGVTSRGEIRLHPDVHLAPFRTPRIAGILRRVRPRKRAEVLRLFWSRYETRRRAGLHGGPELRGMRAYRAVWRIDVARGRPPERPHRKVLLSEIKVGE